MALDIKFKEKHYKKSRFGTKSEADLAEFKKQNITQDLNEAKSVAINNIEFQSKILRDKKELIEIPKQNSFLHIITQKQINAFTIILSFLQKGDIDFLQIMSYTIDETTCHTLAHLLETGRIKRLQIIMTETASFRIPNIYKLLKGTFSENRNCNLVFYWVHSKIHLVEMGYNKYVIDGSGNFSQNAQVEHYNIFNIKDMFDFHYKLSHDFFMGEKLRKNHEIYKNF
ncbi:MAG: hypothetical protein VKL60_20840 [Sphaerospermopsis sp.]|nr:hypothetical protein [Sphaerospermopsis sp.]